MNLLNYTKKLFDTINFYDKKVKKNNYPNNMTNPFQPPNPPTLTIIWIDGKEDNDKLF